MFPVWYCAYVLTASSDTHSAAARTAKTLGVDPLLICVLLSFGVRPLIANWKVGRPSRRSGLLQLAQRAVWFQVYAGCPPGCHVLPSSVQSSVYATSHLLEEVRRFNPSFRGIPN